TDVDVLQEMFAAGAMTIVLDFLGLLGILGFMLWINWALALVSMALLPFMVFAIDYFRRMARKTYRLIRERIGRINGYLQEALLGLETAPAPVREGVAARARGEIEFEHVWFAYRGEQWVLRDVSLRIAAGEHVAIVGATGSGKTTLIKLLDRLYDVQRGRILVDGIEVRDWDPTALRRRIAVVLQDVFLFSGAVEDNITLGRGD